MRAHKQGEALPSTTAFTDTVRGTRQHHFTSRTIQKVVALAYAAGHDVKRKIGYIVPK